ncbi:MAG: hypothetical protein KDK05_22255 [Candidatus Competibacteraceae bacterium]|nr:hypothetical protein [Candidatus Competibacteraceae bacterium]
MAFKRLEVKLPPRLWMITARSGDGKSHFSMQMRAPILPIDADNKILGTQRHAVGDVYEFSANHADALHVERIATILDANMPDSGVATITLDSITPILEPIIAEAMEQAKSSKNKIAPFKAKADAVKKLTHSLHKWGCDVLWIYHIDDAVDTSGNKTQRTSIPATELARIAKSVNMRLSIVRDGDRRGIRVDYAQHGKYGMTLWDEVGGWRGMPERIEQVVYSDGVLATPIDPTSFANQSDAIAWGFGQGCFGDSVHSKNAYDKLKEQINPKNAQEMWSAWISDVKRRVSELEAKDAA